MPLPSPGHRESKQAFVARFMGDANMNAEYPDQKQRAAIAYSQFGEKKSSVKETLKRAIRHHAASS